MKTLKLGNLEIEFDSDNTRRFYAKQNGFVCNCPNCLNYVDKLSTVKNLMNGLDEKIGIDLSKDVGQGMDELMPQNNEDHCLYVIPYYVNGKCKIEGKSLAKQQNGPIWPNTNRVEHKLNENLSLLIINTSESVEFENAECVLTIWLEFKTQLLRKIEREEKVKPIGFWNRIKKGITK